MQLEIVTCGFCQTQTSIDDAINADWIPYFWKPNHQSNKLPRNSLINPALFQTTSNQPACPHCANLYLNTDDMTGESILRSDLN